MNTGKKHTLQKLAKKVVDGTATDAEKKFLDEYYDLFSKSGVTEDLHHEEMNAVGEELGRRLSETISSPPNKRLRFLTPFRMAASIALLLFCGTAVYFWYRHEAQVRLAASGIRQQDKQIVQGSSKAMLTLADGRKITLNEGSPKILTSGGRAIAQRSGGQLNYQVSSGGKNIKNQSNIIEIPRGGMYQITLSDGTRVWLNSASKLRFPVAFSNNERLVELEGEAYFEVAHQKQCPFRVRSSHQTIEVLGTHFNVSTYPEQIRTRTTLLQGSVRVLPAGTDTHQNNLTARKCKSITRRNRATDDSATGTGVCYRRQPDACAQCRCRSRHSMERRDLPFRQ